MNARERDIRMCVRCTGAYRPELCPACVAAGVRRGRTRLSIVLAVLLWLLAVVWLVFGGSARAEAGAEEFLQPVLDRGHTVRLAANATYVLDVPLRVPSRARIVGGGFGSVLKYSGPGDVAIVVGNATQPAYAWELRGFSVLGGGIDVARCSNRCRIVDVWISGAPGPGLRIEGPGDRLVVDGLDVGSCGVGVVIRGTSANNGLLLRDCGLSGNRGPGLVVETAGASSAHVQALRLEHCTIQGNGTGMVGETAEVVIRGAVTELVMDHGHIESPFSGAGLRIEAGDSLPNPSRPGTVQSRAPRNLVIRDTRFDPIVPGAAAIEVRAMEGSAGSLRLEDCRLRMPIRASVGTPAVVQTGSFVQAVEVGFFPGTAGE